MVAFFMANSMTQAPTQVTLLLKEPVNFCRHFFCPRAKPVTTKTHWSWSEDLAAFRSYDRRLLSHYFVVREPVLLPARQRPRLNPLGSPRRLDSQMESPPGAGRAAHYTPTEFSVNAQRAEITQNLKIICFDFGRRDERTIQAGSALYWQASEGQAV